MALSGNYGWSSSASTQRHVVVGRKTKPLRSSPTPYYSQHSYSVNNGGYTIGNSQVVSNVTTLREGSGEWGHLYSLHRNLAIERWRNGISGGQDAAWLTAIAEINSTWGMVGERLHQVGTGYRALRKGNFRKFLKTFEIEPRNRHRHKRWNEPAAASRLWLEYWFGWAPTVGDIQSGLEVLTSTDPFPRTVRASSKTSFTKLTRTSSGENEYYKETIQDHEYSMRFKIQSDVVVSNPNVYLAQRLGLLNPVATLLEVIPFSWLVGWAVNVDQVIQSWSADFGLTHTNAFSTVCVRGKGVSRFSWPYKGIDDAVDAFSVGTRRAIGVPSPTLRFSIPDRLSWTRAATLSSVVVQLFTGSNPIPRI